MFSATAAADRLLYSFESEENGPKWKGLLVNPLQKVQRQVHPSLTARDDALEYIEHLILQLLGMLCASQPHMVQDVEDRVQKTFPNPIDKWAIGDAQNALEKGKKKAPLVLPVDKIHPLLVKEVLGYKIDMQVSLYIVAVLEYIAADILKLTGNYVKNIRHTEISCQDIKVAMNADKVLMEMFSPGDEVSLSLTEEPQRRVSLTYEEMVKDLVLEEDQYIRDLNMIIKVFRQPFAKLFPRSKDLEVIYSNVLDIRRLTLNLVSSLEDTIEMTEESEVPLIGACFEELAEGEEFDIYVKFAEDMLKPYSRERLNVLLLRDDVTKVLQTSGQGFKDAVKYVLPKLLLGPIYHCFHYLDVIKLLMDTTSNEDDKFSLMEAYGVLQQLKSDMERRCTGLPKKRPAETSLSFHNHMGRPAALTKMNELQKSIDGWEGKHIGESCNEFIMEGLLNKYAGKKATERHVFLFDGLIILCKQNTRRSSVTGTVGEYRLKEKFLVRKVEIVDKEDTDELKHAFEIQARDHGNMILSAKNAEEKNNWMAALVSLQTRSMLERMLDGILQEEERQQPLKLPNPEEYRFAKDDTEGNIVFEDNCDAYEAPLIRGGTLLKLVERLTYHKYFDPNFVRTFLTTYRSFCSPQELLGLLIERFNIPEVHVETVPADEDEEIARNRDDLKRFRQVYSKPIKFRVLNVFRQWIDKHFYDFERDKHLLVTLLNFLDTVKGKAMKKGVDSIMRHIKKKEESANEEIKLMHIKSPPPIEWHLTKEVDQFDLMTLHPIEIARQVTLLEFDLYRAVKPSELVGSVWIKKDKLEKSPNLLKMIHHSTVFTFWLEKCIIEAENIEERGAVMSRILEIMLVFQDLNNFNGVLEVVSAFNSAPVFRLEHTFEEVPHKFIKAFDEAKELNADHFKKYIEKLRSINPPCVPFLGMYLTNILLTEEGNLDFLSNRPGIINFSKRRKVAEITGEIQQYQNTPYCLNPDSDIRNFIENLDPLDDMSEKEFNDYLYDKSLEIEPRNIKQPPKFPRKTEYNLKSPGVKPSSRHTQTRSHPIPLPDTKVANQRLTDDDVDAASSRGATPPTPSTPLSPTHTNSGTSDNSVFANVIINPGPGSIYSGSSMSIASTSTITSSSSMNHGPPLVLRNISDSASSGYGSTVTLESENVEPPPVPPRKKRESSAGDILSSFGGIGLPPAVPPRDASSRDCVEPAPPVPPRREFSHGTLPRANSMSLPRQTQPSSSTLPRRNSDRDHLSINGDGSERIPKVPPKTYKLTQDRVQRR